MGDYYKVAFDLDNIRSRMPGMEGRPATTADVVDLLAERFEKSEDGWLLKTPDFALFRPDEILSARSMDDGTLVDFTNIEPEPPEDLQVASHAHQQVIERLAALSRANKCLIPSFLIGDYRSVMMRSKPIIRRALKGESWNSITANFNLKPISEIDLPLAASARKSRGLQRVILFSFIEQFRDGCFQRDSADHPDYFDFIETKLLTGLDHFWFFLCLCCSFGGGGIIGPAVGPSPPQQRAIAVSALQKILNWWPYLCACRSQFVDDDAELSLPKYWSEVGTLANHIGISDATKQLFHLDIEDAEPLIREWLARA